MVDKERRDAIKKLGLLGAGIGLGGAGGAGLWNAIAASDDRFNPDLVAAEAEHDASTEEWSNDMTEIGSTLIDLDGVTVTYTRDGVTGEGGDRYTYTLTAPLRDDAGISICDHADNRHGLLDGLYSDALFLFEGFYDRTGKYNENRRAPHEDAITTYGFRFEDGTGTATADLSADAVSGVTRGEGHFHPDEYDQRSDFRQQLYRSLRVECDTDG